MSASVPARWDRGRLTRRRLLAGGSLAVAGLAVAGLAGCAAPPPDRPEHVTAPRPRPAPAPPAAPSSAYAGPMSEWSHHARLADAAGLADNPSAEEMLDVLERLKAQHVSVVEADTSLSDWQTDEQFAETVAEIADFNRRVHGTGLKVVWYYPSLEVISPGGEFGPSFYKTYPDWAQVGIHGEPNVFHGGVVFWVEPGNESVWLSPDGPWRDYYLRRVKQIAQAGADGLWPDVPLYFAGVVSWCDQSSWGKAAFRRDTGLEAPPAEDWSERAWRRWIEWRHQNLARFLLDVAATGRSVNPEFETFVETVTMDYLDATIIGFDGAYLRLAEGITHVWEVDVVSEDDGMRHATEDDWICLVSMYKYARAASGRKPAWAFCYGLREDDAEQVMAECLIAGCNPYEVKTPEKQAGVSPAMRTRLYGFVEQHTARLFDSRSLAQVALYHSSASRDYTPRGEGTGLFASTTKPPGVKKWWSEVPIESCYGKEWLGEYRGMVKALVHGHIPFDVLTSPTLQADDLAGYRVLLLPCFQAVGDGEADLIRAFVAQGGSLVVTGPNPTGLNEYGDRRREYALANVLGFSREAPPASARYRPAPEAGAVYYFADLPGQQYLNETRQADYDRIVGSILQVHTPFVATDADRRVRLETRALEGEAILQFSNLIGAHAEFSVVPTQFNVWVAIPEGQQVREVAIASPDHPSPDLAPLPFGVADGQVSFAVDLYQYALVVVGWA